MKEKLWRTHYNYYYYQEFYFQKIIVLDTMNFVLKVNNSQKIAFMHFISQCYVAKISYNQNKLPCKIIPKSATSNMAMIKIHCYTCIITLHYQKREK